MLESIIEKLNGFIENGYYTEEDVMNERHTRASRAKVSCFIKFNDTIHLRSDDVHRRDFEMKI